MIEGFRRQVQPSLFLLVLKKTYCTVQSFRESLVCWPSHVRGGAGKKKSASGDIVLTQGLWKVRTFKFYLSASQHRYSSMHKKSNIVVHLMPPSFIRSSMGRASRRCRTPPSSYFDAPPEQESPKVASLAGGRECPLRVLLCACVQHLQVLVGRRAGVGAEVELVG